MRVLMPQRLDVLSRAMDANIVAQWTALAAACDLVLWGPGLEGHVAGMPLDEVAEHVDADVVLLPDFHHAIPGLWDELLEGVERVRRPIVWHLCDHGSEVARRRALWERVKPAAVVTSCNDAASIGTDLQEAYGTRVLLVPWGYDAGLFHADGAAERDIDLLLAGCEVPPEVYVMRNRIKRAARSLAGEHRVVDLSHPGYWETTGVVTGRGQAQYADLLRRARLATTGTAFGSALTRKYWEVAACGAVGVGDLPLQEPDADRFVDAMLAVQPDWEEDRIAQEMRALLEEEARREQVARRAVEAVRGCDHAERAHDYVAALATVALQRGERRPRPAQPPALTVCCSPEPASVPRLRTNWVDVWREDDGASRTRRLARALDGDADVAVVAFDPDAALDVDALVLATACRSAGRVVLRPAADDHGGDVLATDWAAVAAPREALRRALSEHGGRAGVERALLDLGRRLGWTILAGGVFCDVSQTLMRMTLRPELRALEHAHARALSEGRTVTAVELAGLRAACGLADPDPPCTVDVTPQDPDCELVDGASFVAFDPRDDAAIAAMVAHARRGPQAPPLHVGVPVTAGLPVEEALRRLTRALVQGGVDIDACADLVVLERPLFCGELQWLEQKLPQPKEIASQRR